MKIASALVLALAATAAGADHIPDGHSARVALVVQDTSLASAANQTNVQLGLQIQQ